MTSLERRIARISDQLHEKQRDRATVFYKDGTKTRVDIITVLVGVLAGPCTMERVECGPGCGMLPGLINALLDPKE